MMEKMDGTMYFLHLSSQIFLDPIFLVLFPHFMFNFGM